MGLMHRYTQFVIKRPYFVLITLLVVTIILSSGLATLKFDTSIETYLPKRDKVYQTYNQVKEVYGDVDTFLILDISTGNLWSHDTFKEIDNLLTDLEEYKDYDEKREASRLNTLQRFRTGNEVPFNELAAAFEQDPPFVRFLKRTFDYNPGNNLVLSAHQIRKLHERTQDLKDLKKRKITYRIISPFTTKDIIGVNDTLKTYHLIEKDGEGKRILPKSEEDFRQFQKKLLRNPAFEKGIYSKDSATGKITDLGFIVRFSKDSNTETDDAMSREILKIVGGYPSLKIITQGQPLVYVWIVDAIQRDFYVIVPLALLVVMIVLYINFRSVRGVWLPVVTIIMATAWDLGLMGLTGVALSPIGVSLPPLLICVGSAYAIHVMSQYYEDLELIQGTERSKGLLSSMAHINVTVGIAGLTTIISFWTLATHQLSALRIWGFFSGLGVTFAVFIAMTLIPAVLAILPHRHHFKIREARKSRSTGRSPVEVVIRWFTTAALNHPGKVMIVIGAIIVFSIIGIFRIHVETELLQYFKADNPIRQSEKVIGEKFGGRWGFNILIDSGVPDGVKTTEYLNTIDNVRAWLESDENSYLNIGRTDAFSDYIRTMHMAMNNDDRAYFAIPSNSQDIKDYLEIYSDDDLNSDGRIDDFEPYVDPKFQTCNILTRICQKQGHMVGTVELEGILNKISDYLKSHLPENYSVTISGHPTLIIKTADYIMSGQISNLIQSIIVISIVVFIVVRNVLMGFLSLIPLVLAVTLNFGIMGWTGIPLDVATSVIAAITIGIGDDVTIHFINTWRHRMKAGRSIDESIKEALAESGRANIFTALSLMAGFSVCCISTFKPVVLFGMLMAVVLTANNIGALLLLPAAIKLTGIDLNVVKVKKPIPAPEQAPPRISAMKYFRLVSNALWNGRFRANKRDK
ncbi:MAG: MMPL family transporter [Deltaproteobacteria bacterium]|nr:MMPL family transporter [Deltaproteobacteria bacterium]